MPAHRYRRDRQGKYAITSSNRCGSIFESNIAIFFESFFLAASTTSRTKDKNSTRLPVSGFVARLQLSLCPPLPQCCVWQDFPQYRTAWQRAQAKREVECSLQLAHFINVSVMKPLEAIFLYFSDNRFPPFKRQ